MEPTTGNDEAGQNVAATASNAGSSDRTARRLDLEIQKLEAEIAKLKRESRTSWGARAKGWTTLVIAILTILASGWGLFTGVSAFLDQKKREYDFQVNKEIIELSRQLGSGNPIERTNAALLLSGFEEDAVPILISNLRVTDNPSLISDTVYSLQLILDKPKIRSRPEVVLEPLIAHTKSEFSRGIIAPDPSIERLANHVNALSALGKGPHSADIIAELRTLQREIAAPRSSITGTKRDGLNISIDGAITALSAD